MSTSTASVLPENSSRTPPSTAVPPAQTHGENSTRASGRMPNSEQQTPPTTTATTTTASIPPPHAPNATTSPPKPPQPPGPSALHQRKTSTKSVRFAMDKTETITEAYHDDDVSSSSSSSDDDDDIMEEARLVKEMHERGWRFDGWLGDWVIIPSPPVGDSEMLGLERGVGEESGGERRGEEVEGYFSLADLVEEVEGRAGLEELLKRVEPEGEEEEEEEEVGPKGERRG